MSLWKNVRKDLEKGIQGELTHFGKVRTGCASGRKS